MVKKAWQQTFRRRKVGGVCELKVGEQRPGARFGRGAVRPVSEPSDGAAMLAPEQRTAQMQFLFVYLYTAIKWNLRLFALAEITLVILKE